MRGLILIKNLTDREKNMKEELIINLIKKAIANPDIRNRARANENQPGSDCPPEEILCGYLESNLSDKEKNKVEQHLIYCSYCQDILISTAALELEEKKVQERATETAKGKIANLIEPIKISIAWVKGHLQLIETDAEYPGFWEALVPVMVRNGSQNRAPELPPLFIDSGGYSIYIQIFEEETNRCSIQCRCFRVTRSISKSMSGLKMHADLIEEGKVLLSHPFKEATVYIKDITPGRYELKIYEIQIKAGTHPIAAFPISIEGEKN